MNELNRLQTLRGSFSAVRTATIARKDAFFRILNPIFRDLMRSARCLCLCTVKASKFQIKIVKRFWRNEMKFHFIPILVDEFWSFFREVFPSCSRERASRQVGNPYCPIHSNLVASFFVLKLILDLIDFDFCDQGVLFQRFFSSTLVFFCTGP